MRKALITFITVCTLAVLPVLSSSENEGYYSRSYARLSYVKGDIFVKRGQDLGYEEGVVNLPVVENDMVGTREGRAEVHFGLRNYLRMDNNTQLEIVRLPRRDEDVTRLNLMAGGVFLRINFLEKEKSFELHTPDASFYFLGEGLYRFEVGESGKTGIFVYEGALEAAGEAGSVLVQSEERLVAVNGAFNSNPVIFSASLSDDFADWNAYRDSLLNKRAEKTYLPAELSEYEVELSSNGRWEYESPYGYVWVPYVYDYDWRPYYNGRWAWYPVIGWTWVSYDPWGWAVYHYGRWHWRGGLGWYWIPTRFWGPAWVHWYWGYDYFGWCPISYYDYPIVIINNIFYDRYHSSSYPYRSKALTVVRKSQMQSRTISKVALKASEIKQIGKISLTREKPEIKPTVRKISQSSDAARVLVRPEVRKVEKSYISGKKLLSPSQLKTQTTDKPAKKISIPSVSIKKYAPKEVPGSRSVESSMSKLKKYLNTGRPETPAKKSTSSETISRSRIKTYSSNNSFTRPSTSLNKEIPSSKPRAVTSREVTTNPTIQKYQSRTPNNSSITSSSQSKSVSSYRSEQKNTSPVKSYLSKRYNSSSQSYSPPKRVNTSKSSTSTYSPSKSTYSSMSTSSRSSTSTVSRSSTSSTRSSTSSTRSSSSTSSRTSKVKKK